MRKPGIVALPALLPLLLCLPRTAAAQAPEYEVKATILERLTGFVEWPPEALDNPSQVFDVCVFGTNPFGSILEEIFADQRVAGRPVVVRHVADVSELDPCRLLFIGGTDAETASRVLLRTRGRAVLTVSDRAGFTSRGVLVTLELAQRRVQLVVNETAVRESGLRMSHLLLGMARIVNPYARRP